MKIEYILENTVDNSLAMRRITKQARDAGEAKRKRREEKERIKSEMFTTIDNAVAETIDFLVNEKGLEQAEAEKAVYSHLSDLAMMHDMSRGGM